MPPPPRSATAPPDPRGKDDTVIAVAILGAGIFDEEVVALVFIRHIVVVPEWRASGIGTFSVGVVPELMRLHTEKGSSVA